MDFLMPYMTHCITCEYLSLGLLIWWGKLANKRNLRNLCINSPHAETDETRHWTKYDKFRIYGRLRLGRMEIDHVTFRHFRKLNVSLVHVFILVWSLFPWLFAYMFTDLHVHSITFDIIVRLVAIFTSYLPGKGGYVFGIVGLSVCLFMDNITQKVINGCGWPNPNPNPNPCLSYNTQPHARVLMYMLHWM